MTSPADNPWQSRLAGALRDWQVRLSLLAAMLLLLEAVVAKNVIGVRLDSISQSVAMWIFIVYMISGQRGRTAALGTAAIMTAATAAVLLLYAI